MRVVRILLVSLALGVASGCTSNGSSPTASTSEAHWRATYLGSGSDAVKDTIVRRPADPQ